MNINEKVSMQDVTVMVKSLIDAWRGSKCPGYLLPADCCDCKYRGLFAKLDELSKVVGK